MGLVELIGEGPDTIHLFANQCAASYCGKTPETLKGARGSTFCDKSKNDVMMTHNDVTKGITLVSTSDDVIMTSNDVISYSLFLSSVPENFL